MRILRIVLAVFLVETVIAQQPSPASLEGVVVQLGTNVPLAGATVDLRTDSGTTIGVTTDRDGKFLFPGVQPGRYRLLATRPGFVRAEYGLQTDNAPWHGMPMGMTSPAEIQTWRRGRPTAQGLTVGAGQRLAGLRIVMTPGGVITGRVTDGGKPAVAVAVSAVRIAYSPEGKAVMSKLLSGNTNDLGEYHIFWLPPGRYYVMADRSDTMPIPVPQMFINPTDGAENPLITRGAGQAEMSRSFLPGESASILFLRSGGISDSEMLVPKFFPNKSDWHDATVVEIGIGAEIRNVDIEANPVPALHVRGTVQGAPLNAQGQLTRPQVALFRAGSISAGSYASIQADMNGSFDLPRIPPGSYLLRASAGNLTARVPIDVRDRDINGVTVALVPGVTISGRVVLDQPDVGMGNLNLGLRMESADAPTTMARPAADGSFTIPGVVQTESYRVFVRPILLPLGNQQAPTLLPLGNQQAIDQQPAPVPPAVQNAYVKSITLGREDVLNDGLRVTNPSPPQLVITIGANAGSLEGRVVNGQQPVPATVVLIPESAQQFHVPHKFVYADESGRFQITAVPPGDYKLFAWESVEPYAWQNADFVRNDESQGKLVQIDEGAKMTGIELKAIP